jgi:hypothetical protein
MKKSKTKEDRREERLDKLRRDPKEELFVCEMTEEEDGIDGYGVFGMSSGFCYASFMSEREANKNLEEREASRSSAKS